MACFAMCENCAREYEDPLDRRFHAQPNACPVCGPRVWLTDQKGEEQAERREAVRLTAERLAGGEIAAIKGLGGFHLACDAACDEAVERLRRRKNRPDKPLAVMAPDMETAMLMAQIGRQESWWLSGIHRPIVLARKRKDSPLSKLVAPDTGHVGLMLPYTPLHHVLLAAYRRIIPDDRPSALVMTSGNMSSEPIALGNREALHRLAHIADFFLLHDRDILIRCDDSVLRVVPGQIGEFMPEGYEFPPGTQLLRRARGFTPVPVFLSREGESVLGTGPELKNTMALTKGGQAFVSQHIGDMENLETLAFWNEIRKHLKGILETEPKEVVRDLHPDYMTTRWAEEQAEKPVHPLQHHYAHVHAVLAEHRIEEAVLGLALDGTGYGDDGSLWGGELLYVDPAGPEHGRLAHFSPVRLPGGEAAIRGPWRIAQAVLHDMGMREPRGREWPWLKSHARASEVTAQLLDKDLNCPRSTSCGRLFDAVSAMLGLCLSISYEAQAAIVLEQVQDMNERGAYPVRLDLSREPAVLDTFELFGRVLDDFEAGVSAGRISRRFHLGLVQGLADLTSHFRDRTGISAVALSGGVMQNLTVASLLPVELAKRRLDPLLHGYLPPGDACISLGQAHYGLSLRKDTPQK
jgi:hydrogenase maturation protein HypF